MLNLFDGFKNAPKEHLIDQIAALRTMNIKNSLKQTANKGNRKVRKAFNWASNIIGSEKKLNVPKEKNILQEMKKARKLLTNLNKKELLKELKIELSDKVDNNVLNDEETLSKLVIEEAAKDMDIKESISINQKARLIKEKFSEMILEEAEDNLENMNEVQQKEFDKEFNEQIKKIDEDNLKAIKKDLKIDELNGKTIRKILTKSGSAVTALALVQLSGFGAYLMITTVMHAIFTTMLGITLPFAAYTGVTGSIAFLTGPFGWFIVAGVGGWQLLKGKNKINRMLLAQSVYFAVSLLEEKIVIPKENLPSWLPENKNSREKKIRKINKLENKIEQLNQRLSNSSKEVNQYKNKINNLKEKYEEEKSRKNKYKALVKMTNRKMENLKDNIQNQKDNINELKNKIGDYKRKNNDIPEKLKSELASKEKKLMKYREMIKKEKNDKEDYEKLLDEADNEINNYKKQIDNKKEKINEIKSKNKKLKIENERLEKDLKNKVHSESKEIKKSWDLHFDNLYFGRQPLKWTAKQYFNNRLDIERRLKEINNHDNPSMLSKSKLHELPNNPHHCNLKITGRDDARIAYTVSGEKVKIQLMYFKNEQDKIFNNYS